LNNIEATNSYISTLKKLFEVILFFVYYKIYLQISSFFLKDEISKLFTQVSKQANAKLQVIF
jgi:hypothetical protein